MKKHQLLFLFIFISNFIFGQDTLRCHTLGLKLSESQIKEHLLFEEKVQKYLSSNFRLENVNITIPVVVHVVYNLQKQYVSEEQVLSQIAVLNQDYSRTNSDTSQTPNVFKQVAGASDIRFKLAVQDPNGKPTNGITYTNTTVSEFSDDDKVKLTSSGGIDAWDPKSYLNLWVCNLTPGVLGYFPGDSVPHEAGTYNDGVVVSYRAFGTIGSQLSSTYNLGRTSTHEIGHWLGLYHPWGTPWGSLCSSDYINDTPQQKDGSRGCPVFPYIDSDCFNAPNGRNYSNFMDYTSDRCMNMFTKGQVQRMMAILNLSRNSILTSKALDPPFNKDLAISIVFDSSEVCSRKDIFPKVRIFNYGKDTVTDYSISFTYNGTTNSYSWKGKLPSLSDTVWVLNDVVLSPEQVTLSAEVSFNKPGIDEFLPNNAKILSFACTQPLSIYPNPVSETLYVSGNLPKVNSSIIYNLQGEEVLKVNNATQIDVTGLEPGFYLIVLETNEKAIRKQLIVIK